MSADAPERAVDVFLESVAAECFLDECLRDEAGWADVLRVEEIDLDERDVVGELQPRTRTKKGGAGAGKRLFIPSP